MDLDLGSAILRSSREYRELIETVLRPSGRQTPPPVFASGLSEASKRAFLTSSARDLTAAGARALFVFPDDREAERAAEEMTSLGVDALFYPSKDYNFNNVTVSRENECARLRVLSLVSEAKSPFAVCAGVHAALQITPGKDAIDSLSVTLDPDGEIDVADLCDRLLTSGYKRVEMVEGPGQFTVRGGIIDVYPTRGDAIRVELFGDEVDRLGNFDVMTQRFTDFLNGPVTIPPAREVLIDGEDRDELLRLLRLFKKKLLRTTGDPRALQVLDSEISSLSERIELDSADKYIPVLLKDGSSLAELFRGAVFLIGPPELKERADAASLLLDGTLTSMIEQGELFTSFDSEDYVRPFSVLERKEPDRVTVSVTGVMRNAEAASRGAASFVFDSRHIPAYKRNTELFFEDVSNFVAGGYLVGVAFATENERREVTAKLVSDGISVAPFDGGDLPAPTGKRGIVVTAKTAAEGGFELVASKHVLLDFSGFGDKRAVMKRKLKKKIAKGSAEAITSYADLEVGDFVVHASYGIGQFKGIENLTVGGVSRDYVKIDYAGGDNLFLPVDQLDLVSKYIGAGSDDGTVKLSKMGGADWNRARTRAKAATREMAKELIALYAERRRTKGCAFEPDDEMSREFASTFEYEETDGQLSAIEDVRRDMEQPYPMDRLICGDVGYGKTEVALRAAFKAVMSGKQVAVLVPTTLLAYQHYNSFAARLRSFPVSVDMISRFRTRSEQQSTLRRLRRGDLDIIIGTHRLISKDVEFHDLGLVVVDEEQRFGVAQKEKLKKISVGADVLTLTATPIPRTLNMAMGGIVDMSLLDEAPGARLPVQTYVLEYDEVIIYEAIRRELRRQGQVFYLYNRVEGIYGVARRIAEAIPEASVAVAHGKMDRDELEEIWESIIRGEIDVLVCTTIIETGVDIPNANTLIIESADLYGLSQLHQIRGRVGRSGRRAYAYFTYRKNKSITDIAEKRLSAIKEYAEFGAGYKIALRDMEIRGAGNLLGAEQHGHMEAVGYDLYMKLLSEAVVEEKGETLPLKKECAVSVNLDAYLSKEYIPSAPQRMEIYKKLARISCDEDAEDMIDELCDRFGEPGRVAMNLVRIALIRAKGSDLGITKIEEREGAVRFFPDEIDPAGIMRLSETMPRGYVRILPGNPPFFTCRLTKGAEIAGFITDILNKLESYKKEKAE
ncbi:MAG: transcription-repair coupling factor [Clostridia bacterium]|nr:transcription-repair coupling factor [Clostridia bacterium]